MQKGHEDKKELQDRVMALCKEFNIKRGMIMFKQDTRDSSAQYARVFVFDSVEKITATNKEEETLNLRNFAQLFIDCLHISKTLQRIMEIVSQISLQNLTREVENKLKLHNTDEEKLPN